MPRPMCCHDFSIVSGHAHPRQSVGEQFFGELFGVVGRTDERAARHEQEAHLLADALIFRESVGVNVLLDGQVLRGRRAQVLPNRYGADIGVAQVTSRFAQNYSRHATSLYWIHYTSSPAYAILHISSSPLRFLASGRKIFSALRKREQIISSAIFTKCLKIDIIYLLYENTKKNTRCFAIKY